MILASTLGELVHYGGDRYLRVYFNRASEWPYTSVMYGRGDWRRVSAHKSVDDAIAFCAGYSRGVSEGIDGDHAFVRQSSKVNILG